MTKLLAAFIVLATTAPAYAGYEGEPARLLGEWIKSRKKSLGDDPNTSGVTECEAGVAEGKKQGLTKLRSIDGDIPIEEAAKICAEGARYNVLLKDYKVFTDLIDNMRYLRTDMMPSEEYVAKVLQAADRCNKAVDAMLAAKIPATEPYEIKGTNQKSEEQVFAKTVADIKPNICEAAKKASAQFNKAAEAEAAKARAKYTKVGIKEDKLDLMLGYDGSVFLPGGASSADMKKYAAASVLFVWLTSDPDAQDFVVHTVRRYQYKGNKLVSQTEKTYRKKRGAKLGAAPFK